MTSTSPVGKTRNYARIAGWSYLIIIVAGLFAEFAVRSEMIVPGDAVATAQNVLGSETMFRVGLVGDLIMLICDAVVAWALYMLLRPVDRGIALLAMVFRLIHTAILGINLLAHTSVLLLLNGGDYLSTFPVDQIQSLVLFALNAHSSGYLLGQVFFGVHCLILGYLLFRSGFIPKVVGALVAAAGLGYLIESFVMFLSPSLVAVTYPGLMVAVVAELTLCVWLIVKSKFLSQQSLQIVNTI